MSDYNKSTNFTSKDTLPTGNSNKIVKGTELDIEFTAISSAIASKANSDSPSFTGTPTVPTATAGANTTQIASCAFVLANSIPSGIISMWSGTIASIPSGWYLCNGSNGTPDLRNKFIVGADADVTSLAKTTITGSATQTGGSKDAVNVSHTHTATVDTVSLTGTITGISESFNNSGSCSGIFTKQTGYGVTVTPIQNDAGNGGQATLDASHTHAVTNSTEGSSGTNANLPPYYALAFIMKA